VLTYYLELAVRNLRRSPGLTALMMLAIGFGVATSMTMYSVFRGLSADPIPWKSSHLFVPQIDAWGPNHRAKDGEPPTTLTYVDAMALMREHRAYRQSAIVAIWRLIMPPRVNQDNSPIDARGYAVYSEFFPMLDVSFRYGSGWSADDDATQNPVVVISDQLNQQVFGGGNSVGKTIAIDKNDYRVVGVIKYWNPQPEFFALMRYERDQPDFFLPVTFGVANGVLTTHADCTDGPYSGNDFAALLRSDCVWLSYMVEIDNPTAVRAYREYLDAYASEQQQLGRFQWRPNNRLRDVTSFLDYQHLVPSGTRLSLLVAQGLLVVCLLNTVALSLAKFLRRSGEIAVRRALGASRASIYAQFLIEAGVIGAGGGLLGLLLTAIGVLNVGVVMPAHLAALARIDPTLLMLTLLLAVTATLLAALYPTYRASRVQPALLIKAV
jgi:putative ABC transport system permease protein